MKANKFDHVLNAIKLLKTREFPALVHMVAVEAKDDYNNGKHIKSAVMFTKDYKSTVKITRIGKPDDNKVSIVVSLGRPAYGDLVKHAKPSGIILRYTKPKSKSKSK